MTFNNESSTRLRVTYTLQPPDQIALVAFIERKSRPLVWAVLFVVLFAFLLLPNLTFAVPYWRMSSFEKMLYVMRLKHHWPSMLMPTLMPTWLFPPIFAWVVWKNKRQRARDFRENEELRQPRTIELAPENLHIVTAVNETRVHWKSLHEVGENETYIFLLTAANTGHAIPKNAFGAASEAKIFAQTALSYWEKAHPTEIKAPLPDPRETTL